MATLGLPKSYSLSRNSTTRKALPPIQNGSSLRPTMCKESAPCNSEIFVRTNEDPSIAVSRFTRECMNTNLFTEVQKKKRFENKQDRIKRKLREKGLRKLQSKYPVETFAAAQKGRISSAPFQDLYEKTIDEDDEFFGDGGFFSSGDAKKPWDSSSLDVPSPRSKSDSK